MKVLLVLGQFHQKVPIIICSRISKELEGYLFFCELRNMKFFQKHDSIFFCLLFFTLLSFTLFQLSVYYAFVSFFYLSFQLLVGYVLGWDLRHFFPFNFHFSPLSNLSIKCVRLVSQYF